MVTLLGSGGVGIEETTVAAGGFHFRALAAGPADGELVMLLHGFPQSSSCWIQAMESLGGAGYRALAPDQRGYSPGARPEGVEGYRKSALVADAMRIAEAVGHRRFHVIGHDWGATVAWSLAAAHPERVTTLTALATPHTGALTLALRGPVQQARFAYMRLLQTPWIGEASLTLGGGLVGWFVMEQALVATGLPRALARRDLEALRETGVTGPLNWYRALQLRGEGVPVDEVAVPTLYVWASKDAAFGREAAEATEEFVTGPYHFVDLEGATHWIPDLYWDDINDLVLEHLAGG
jgi:pimeloyl-ACP methyl ester carboxylesterase